MKIHSLARRACITQAAIVVLGSLLATVRAAKITPDNSQAKLFTANEPGQT